MLDGHLTFVVKRVGTLSNKMDFSSIEILCQGIATAMDFPQDKKWVEILLLLYMLIRLTIVSDDFVSFNVFL
jgi:hypothetical protein